MHGIVLVRSFRSSPQQPAAARRVLPAFLSQALRGENLAVFGDGSQTRSFCYVDDLSGTAPERPDEAQA